MKLYNNIGFYSFKKDMIYMDGEFTLDDLKKIVKMCKKQYRKDKLNKFLRLFNGCK